MSFVPDGLIAQARAEGAAAERRRLRRSIVPHLRNLFLVNDQHNLPYVKGAADAIDRATKAARKVKP